MKKKGTWLLPAALILSTALGLAGCGKTDTKTAAASGAAASGAASPAAAAATAAKFPEKLNIGYISANNSQTITGPEGWAQEQGKLQQELGKYGVKEFKYIPFPNGPNLNEAMTAGQVDIGIYGDTPAINGRSAGLKGRLINISQSGMNAWLVTKEGSGISSVADLKGKKVATSQGSYMNRYLVGLLKEQGLDKDVKLVHLLPPDGEAALARGEIAAYAYPSGSGPAILKKGGYTVIDEAKKHPALRGSSVTVVREAYLKDNPEFPKVWNQLRKDAIADAKKNVEPFYQLLAKTTGFSVEVVKESYPFDQWKEEDLAPDAIQLVEGTKAWLVQEGLAKKDFALDEWIYK
ncbi:ABC transporter substrate-binding protein [Paenibacillus chartarius]|uniref:ABC transporter substrate-binding protein n=1 Tax=Paenibacillus chartarius TaxID=747481 RepID=A0ABV6DTI6_9BACL